VQRQIRWPRAVLIAGLVVGASGIVLMSLVNHRHEDCGVPSGSQLAPVHGATVTGVCSVANTLFTIGVWTMVVGVALTIGAVVAWPRNR
jgi:hypothetical protein